jgi:hypothetical protein
MTVGVLRATKNMRITGQGLTQEGVRGASQQGFRGLFLTTTATKSSKKGVFLLFRIIFPLVTIILYPLTWSSMGNNSKLSAAGKYTDEDYFSAGRLGKAFAYNDGASRRDRNLKISKDNNRKEEEDLFVRILEENGCTVLEHVCRKIMPQPNKNTSNGVTWFYRPSSSPSSSSSKNVTFGETRKRQPKLLLYTGWYRKLGFPGWIQIKRWDSNATTSVDDKCPPIFSSSSKIRNHIIVSGRYTDMMMEFYVRIVAGVWEIYQNTTIHGHDDQKNQHRNHQQTLFNASSLMQLTQFYIHIQGDKPSNLLPGMHPLMQAFSDWPLYSLTDLLLSRTLGNDILNGRTSFSHTHTVAMNENECGTHHTQQSHYQCMPSLILCGYEQQQGPKFQKLYEEQHFDQLLGPGGQVGRCKKLFMDHPPMDWNGVRNHVLAHTVHKPKDQFCVRQEIQNFKYESVRHQLLRAYKDPTHSLYAKDETLIQQQENSTADLRPSLDQYTLVGLSQRGQRRRWLNMDEVLHRCYKHFLQYKLVCVEINLDGKQQEKFENGMHNSHDFKDVIFHGGLNALIGIHGSQQTNAVYLPAGGYVLELLPYLYGSWGTWTQTTSSPTPNGIMTNETSLIHLGYPLGPDSGVDCDRRWRNNVEQPKKRCVNGTKWTENDFVAPWYVIDKFLRIFLLGQNPTAASAADSLSAKTTAEEDKANGQEEVPLKESAERTFLMNRTCVFLDQRAKLDFVLYNVPCWNTARQKLEYKHYYRERSSFDHLKMNTKKTS